MKKESKEEYWGNKYKDRKKKLGRPETFILNNIKYLNKGSLLDLACGDGRNAIYLAKQGYKVLGVDFSDVAMDRLYKFKGDDEMPLKTKLIDLEDIENIKGLGKFDNIIINHYKPNVEILKILPNLLNEDGIIIICTFNYKHVKEEGFPKRFALDENELIDFSDQLILLKHEVFKDERGNKDGYIYKLK